MKELPGSPGCFGVAGVQGVLYVSTQVPEEQAGARSFRGIKVEGISVLLWLLRIILESF